MDFSDSPQEAAFRIEVREFIERELPPHLARRGQVGAVFGAGSRRFADPEYWKTLQSWLDKLRQKGWIAPAWPKEYGGADMTVMEQFIYNQEMARSGAPRSPNVIGLGWVGPTLILYGTEEQKKRFLPKIISNEEFWCQGFSEPEAGSDLASLQTRAVRDGDDYVINGQKIWTSGAHGAHYMILLARTDPDAPKHKGISYFLLNMKSPGVSVRPLENMTGSHDFNEVFFDNVRVPAENLIGEENRGWYVGTATLDFERSGIATGVSHGLMVDGMVEYARTHDGHDPSLRYELAERSIEAKVEQMLNYQVIGVQMRGEVPSNAASIAKLYSTELDQRIARTGMKMLGLHGLLTKESAHAPLEGRMPAMYMYATTSTIGGGTSEVMRNVIAQRGLGMPRG